MQAYTCTSQDSQYYSLCVEPDTLELCRSGMYRFLLKSSFIGFCAVSLHFSLIPYIFAFSGLTCYLVVPLIDWISDTRIH